jgi:O-antigen ligase
MKYLCVSVFKQFRLIVQEFSKCLAVSPLSIIALILYMGLKSTMILPDGLHEFNGTHHPSYYGWYDLVLGYSIIFSFVSGSLKLELKDFVLGLTLLFIISASWINTCEQDKAFIFDGIVCFIRFFLSFVWAKSLANKLGNKVAESVLLVAYGILAINAVLWYTLQFGEQNRLAASAMTSPSFGQISAILCLFCYGRKYYLLLFISFILLLLTFSRTSILLFLAILILQNRKLDLWKILKYFLGFAVLAGVGVMVMIKYGGSGTEVVLASRFDSGEISNLNGRSDIWMHAINLIKSRHIPIFGIGFHMTPSLIVKYNLKFPIDYDSGFYIPPHYHSILIEYILSLGIFSLVIFWYFITRVWQTFHNNCDPAFIVFAFFLISQVLDYTFNAPKEIIIFSFMLGLAEGQWKQSQQNRKTA